GAEVIYDRVVEPCLVRNEETLDGYLQHARAAAHRSTEAASLSAYDRWAGYMQRAIRQYTNAASPAATPAAPAAEGRAGHVAGGGGGHPGLTDLLKALSQRIPQAAAEVADEPTGAPGSAESPGAQSGAGGGSALATMLMSWAIPFSHSVAGGGMPDEQRLLDIRSRRLQLQEMVSQLEHSERTLLANKRPPSAPESPRHAGAHTDASEFEDDAVMVNEPAGASSSGSGVAIGSSKDASKDAPGPKKPSPAGAASPSSRRWFW
ncbi:hypothetical protein LPJ61_003820, partial [Coemansia biformis]